MIIFLVRVWLWGAFVGLACTGGFAFGQEPVEPRGQRNFRIGYIRQDPEAVTTSGVFQRLREFLLAQPEVQSAMVNAGVDELIAPSFDTHGLLIEAMDAEQVDMAFCSVLDYAYQ